MIRLFLVKAVLVAHVQIVRDRLAHLRKSGITHIAMHNNRIDLYLKISTIASFSFAGAGTFGLPRLKIDILRTVLCRKTPRTSYGWRNYFSGMASFFLLSSVFPLL